jgi:hypothetical protein
MRRYAALLPRLARAAAQAQAAPRGADAGRGAWRAAAPSALPGAVGAGTGWAAAAAAAATASAPRGAAALAAPAAAAAKGLVQLRYLLGVGGVLVAAQVESVADTAKLSALALVRLGRDIAAAAAVVAGARASGGGVSRRGFRCGQRRWRAAAPRPARAAAPTTACTAPIAPAKQLLPSHPPPDYKVTLASAPASGPERQALLAACHERGAERLLALCFANGGIYTKLGERAACSWRYAGACARATCLVDGRRGVAAHACGAAEAAVRARPRPRLLLPPPPRPGQHVGQLDHLLPEQYVTKMRDNLLDKCPVSDFKEVGRRDGALRRGARARSGRARLTPPTAAKARATRPWDPLRPPTPTPPPPLGVCHHQGGPGRAGGAPVCQLRPRADRECVAGTGEHARAQWGGRVTGAECSAARQEGRRPTPAAARSSPDPGRPARSRTPPPFLPARCTSRTPTTGASWR